jgi:hypothetical protein
MNNVSRRNVIVISVFVNIVAASMFGLISLYSINQCCSVSEVISDDGVSCYGHITSHKYNLVNNKIAFVDCNNISICPDPECNAPIYGNMTVYLHMEKDTNYFLIIRKSDYISLIMKSLAPSIVATAVTILLTYMVIKIIFPPKRPSDIFEDNALLTSV